MKITITTGRLPEDIAAVAQDLEGPELAQGMGLEVQRVTADHLRGLGATRHATAQRLGATPTNYFGQAAEKVEAPEALATDGNAALLTINHIGLIRAFRSVTIAPKTAKALAIPVNRIAYGVRPRELSMRGYSMFVLGGSKQAVGRNVLATKTPDGTVIPLYVLVARVTQPQDRSLLPSDEEWSAAAAKGAEDTVVRVMRKKMGLST